MTFFPNVVNTLNNELLLYSTFMTGKDTVSNHWHLENMLA